MKYLEASLSKNENLEKEYPTSFLEKVFEHRQRTLYTRVEVLNWEERVIGEIQGIVKQGTYNADGDSNTRRNLSLTFSTRDREGNKVIDYLTPGTKIALYMGLENYTREFEEDKIIWFNMGIFILSEPSLRHSVEDTELTISAHDKMSMLNGVLGGKLSMPVQFIQRVNGKNQSMSWREIFLNTATLFGNENPAKVVIDSVPDFIEEYTQVKNVAGLKKDFIHVLSQEEGEKVIIKAWHPTLPETQIKFSQSERLYKLRRFGPPEPIQSSSSGIEPYMKNVGENITSVFDDIVEGLSNTHEYYYSKNGDLIFQPVPNYINQLFEPTEDGGLGYFSYELNMEDFIPNYLGLPFTYNFADKKTIVSYNNNPSYGNIKNDFVVVNGKGQMLEIAIDDKPTIEEIKEWFVGLGEDFSAMSSEMAFIQKDGVRREPYNPLNNTVPFEYREGNNYRPPTYIYIPLDKIPWQIALGLKNYYIRNIYGGSSPWILPRWGQECESMIFKYQTSSNGVDLLPNTGIFNPANIAIGEPWLAGYPTISSALSSDDIEELDTNNPIFSSTGDTSFWPYYLDLIDTGTQLGKYSIALIGKRTETVTAEIATTMFKTNPTQMVVVTETELADLGGDEILEDLEMRGRAYAVIRDISEQLFMPEVLASSSEIPPFNNISGDPGLLDPLVYRFNNPRSGISFSMNVGGKFDGLFSINSTVFGEESNGLLSITPHTFKHPITKESFFQSSPAEIKAPWYFENDDSEEDDFTEFAFLLYTYNKGGRIDSPDSSQYFTIAKHDKDGNWFYGSDKEWVPFEIDRRDVIVAVLTQSVYKGEYTYASHTIDEIHELFTIRDTDLENMFSIDGAVDCFSFARNLIYQHTNTADVINISCLPVYTLEPNTLIYVEDEETQIKGMYMINNFSINLSTEGNPLMNISAIAVSPRI